MCDADTERQEQREIDLVWGICDVAEDMENRLTYLHDNLKAIKYPLVMAPEERMIAMRLIEEARAAIQRVGSVFSGGRG